MEPLKTTWNVSCCEDYNSTPIELLKGATREDATVKAREIMDARAMRIVTAEVFDDVGKRIAKHVWTLSGASWMHTNKF